MAKQFLEETAAFIREHRSNESHFSALIARLEEELRQAEGDYKSSLQDLKEKAAAEYDTAKENSGTAWPEFEKFVSGFEKTVLDEMNKAK